MIGNPIGNSRTNQSPTANSPWGPPVMRMPGNGLLGQFDLTQVKQYLQQAYPQASLADIESMARAQAAQAQENAASSLFGGQEEQGAGLPPIQTFMGRKTNNQRTNGGRLF